MILRSIVAFAAFVLSAMPALADGDAEEGKRVFNRCMACHDGKREVNKVGPHLVGVVGRKAGSLESFASFRILPCASTMHTLALSKDTSIPA